MPLGMQRKINGPEEMQQLGGELAKDLRGGDVVLLAGTLGAGKTTLVRGLLAALGFEGEVRSPTYNLVQTFSTEPPVMHADLYRVQSYAGIGLEEYLENHLCLIEWPDRAEGLVDPSLCWQVEILFVGEDSRDVIVTPPEV